jgi:hypothetical protein
MEDMIGEQEPFHLREYKCRSSWAELGDNSSQSHIQYILNEHWMMYMFIYWGDSYTIQLHLLFLVSVCVCVFVCVCVCVCVCVVTFCSQT